jgi:L-aminopeptidase/D-esterase-like protein
MRAVVVLATIFLCAAERLPARLRGSPSEYLGARPSISLRALRSNVLVSGNATLTAVPGIKVGHHTLTGRPTGCTVVLVEGGTTAGVDVRGAAPATRDTDLLRPEKMVQQVHGIALSGGSLFGLASADGVLRFLEDKKVGIAYGGMRIPIVPGASERFGRQPTAATARRRQPVTRRWRKAASGPAPVPPSANLPAWTAP